MKGTCSIKREINFVMWNGNNLNDVIEILKPSASIREITEGVLIISVDTEITLKKGYYLVRDSSGSTDYKVFSNKEKFEEAYNIISKKRDSSDGTSQIKGRRLNKFSIWENETVKSKQFIRKVGIENIDNLEEARLVIKDLRNKQKNNKSDTETKAYFWYLE